jgi:DNA-binding beta-propeller fold protein YncE
MIVSHTVTSGTPGGGPDGLFDSGLILPGEKFIHNFNEIGTFPYFDLVHPWATGEIIVNPIFPPGVDVLITLGSSVPGCENDDNCFFPPNFILGSNIGTVTWHNSDNAGHTITSGTPGGGPDGLFDSGLIGSGQEFSHQFLGEGIFPYYDILHPWMVGSVIVNQQACQVPTNGDWVLTESCDLVFDETASANVRVQNDSVLTILSGVTLTIPSTNNITIESGSGVLIKSGGALKISSQIIPNGNIPQETSFLKEFGSFGTGNGKFKSPSGLALDTGTNLLYVADRDNDRIQIIDVDGNCDSNDDEYLADDVCFVDEFGSSGNGGGEFDSPTALVLDTVTDSLYISEFGNDRIQIIDVDGNCGNDELANDVCFVDEFGSSGNGEGEFDGPSGLTLDMTTDLLYIADTGNNRIQIIDVDGNCGIDELANDVCFVDEFGGSGNGEGEFDLPSGLALHTDNDILYVTDTDNNLIQIIDVDGNCSGSVELADDICFVDEFGEVGDEKGEFKSPSGLTLDVANDLLYIADTDNERIQIIDVDGNCLGSDLLTDDVCFVDEFGEVGDGEGEFDLPSALVLDAVNDLLFVADTDNNRIQIFDISG